MLLLGVEKTVVDHLVRLKLPGESRERSVEVRSAPEFCT